FFSRGFPVLPLRPAVVAQINQEPYDHRLVPLAREKLDLLFLVLVEDLEILLVEVGNETALFVRYGHRNDNFVDLDSNGLLPGLRGLRGGWLGWGLSGRLGRRFLAES